MHWNRAELQKHQWLSARTIFAAKHNYVNNINFSSQNEIPGKTTTYKSIDTAVNQDDIFNYSIRFLNSLHLPGMLPRVSTLKFSVPIFFLRGINPSQLCKGIRFSLKKMMGNSTKASILNWKCRSKNFLLSRIPLMQTDMMLKYLWKHLKFRVRLAFATTINKVQGQSPWINLKNQCVWRLIHIWARTIWAHKLSHSAHAHWLYFVLI